MRRQRRIGGEGDGKRQKLKRGERKCADGWMDEWIYVRIYLDSLDEFHRLFATYY